jgi:hypothetical protein
VLESSAQELSSATFTTGLAKLPLPGILQPGRLAGLKQQASGWLAVMRAFVVIIISTRLSSARTRYEYLIRARPQKPRLIGPAAAPQCRPRPQAHSHSRSLLLLLVPHIASCIRRQA